jgi:alkanesulfonate monooxygenase SsuD/methylene tetrahydromethanopterin reductase-like flavin-dependent oxidoreductase (luciferase family)
VAELGLGVLVINPEPRDNLGVDFETYNTVWADNHPNRTAPRPLLSGTIIVDESGERARELSREYSRHLFKASAKNYGMMEEDFATAKGNEFYRRMKIDPEKIDEMADKLSSIMPAGTPQEVLERLDRTNRATGLQGFLPHFHFGSMPRAEAVRNIKLFAQKCLPEIKSWPAESTLGIRQPR